MTDASVHAKQIFRRWIVNAPSSGQQHERRGSSREPWMTGCFKANSGGNPGTAVYKLEPPHCALMPLNHPLLTRGLCQTGTKAGTASVGMVIRHCWRNRPSAYPGLKRAAAHRAPGTHYPVWHCVTLWVCVVRVGKNMSVIWMSLKKMNIKIPSFWYLLIVIRCKDTQITKRISSLLSLPRLAITIK